MKILIVGAGPAGVSAAETVRAHDSEVEIEVLSSEPYPPYSPPAMMDHFLNGSECHFWKGKEWGKTMEVNYRSGCEAVNVDPPSSSVQLADGERIPYDKLVLATGSRLYAPLGGSDLPGVYNFKSLTAAENLFEQIKTGEAQSALIVGAGFIGMEIALLLTELGVQVTQIEKLDQVMGRMLDVETAEIALNQMRARGVEVRLNTEAAAFVGEKAAQAVQLDTGEVLEADLLIAATGVKPNIELIEDCGIDHGWGISVNEHLQTNIKDIYAAGDVVEVEDPLTGQAYVHAIFPNAVEQGQVVGRNLLGDDLAYPGPKRMNSLKHLGLPIMAAGLKEGDDVLRTRQNGTLRTLYLQENRLVGFQLVGDIQGAGLYHALMREEKDITPFKDRLLEPTFGQGTVAWNALLPFS